MKFLSPPHPVANQLQFDTSVYDPLLNSKRTREESGGVDDVTLWRWRKDPRVQFPPPDVIINSRNYWYRSTVRRWQAERTANGQVTLAPSPGHKRASPKSDDGPSN